MRAAIFIDGGYLLKQLQDAKLNPDYTRIAEYLLTPLRRNTQLDLMRCYFYYCPPWMSDKPTEAELRRMAAHDRFVAELQEGCDRWQVRLGKLEKRRDGDKEVFAQKRVDVQLSVDLVHHTAAGHIQHAVLVAGDSDFIPAVAAAKASGATLTLWCDRDRSVHRDLLLHADEVQYFDWRRFPVRKAEPERVEKVAERPEKLAAKVEPNGERGEPLAQEAASAEPGSGERTKKKRSRRRGSGKGAAKAAEAEANGESTGRIAAPAPVQAAPAVAQTSHHEEEPGDHIGNVRLDEDGKPVIKSRRRRGGRGRRRKTGAAPAPSEAD